MPEFAPGESKTAIAPITVKPAGLSSEVEIFLGPNEMTKVATSGKVAFTSTGASQNVRLPITMPAVEGTYHGFIDVYAESLLIAAYKAIEDVVIAVAEGYVSCEVPAQVARGAIPPFGGFGGTAEFWASHRVWLVAREGKLYQFELIIDKRGVPIDPAEYAQPWYGVSEADVLRLWSSTPPPLAAGLVYLPTPAQLRQLFPIDSDGFYEAEGHAQWGAWAAPVSLAWNCSSVTSFPWYVPPPRGIYKVRSRCSIIACSIVPGPALRTWGQGQLLWEVDTGKTIQVV